MTHEEAINILTAIRTDGAPQIGPDDVNEAFDMAADALRTVARLPVDRNGRVMTPGDTAFVFGSGDGGTVSMHVVDENGEPMDIGDWDCVVTEAAAKEARDGQ